MRKIITALPIVLYFNLCSAQREPVLWRFQVETINPHEVNLIIEATVAPGWHLYSQFLKEGGPVPTHITFEKNRDFMLMGRVEEFGEPFRFYDELFEMEIMWYANQARFIQHLRLYRPVTIIKGRIEYMACNDSVCIPASREFSVDIDPSDYKK